MLKTIPICLVALAAIALPALAQSIADVTKEITAGGRGQQWVVSKIITFKSAAKQCASGETYHFKVNGNVDKVVCTNGRLVKTTMTWSLADGPAGDVILNLGGKRFVAELGGPSDRRLLRLQYGAGDAKIAGVKEITMAKAGR